MKQKKLMTDLEQYFKVRFENKIAIREKREDCHLAAATRLLAKKRELEEVGKEVEECEAWYKSKMDDILVQREEIAAREDGLKKSLLKFENFLHENDTKRHRGLAKITQEHALQASKDKQIIMLIQEMEKLNNTKAATQTAVDNNAKFRTFLQTVLDASDQFDEISDMLSRCDILWATRYYLTQREIQNNAIVEDEMFSMIHHAENHTTEILRINNFMSELQTRYDKAQRDVTNSENMWTRIKNTAAKQTLLLGKIKMAIHNLYTLCVRYQQNRLLAPVETDTRTTSFDQLQVIKEVMEDIAVIHMECTRPHSHVRTFTT